MKELRYLSIATFFTIIAFVLYIAYQHIAPYVSTIVLVIITVSLASFVILMASVSLSIWRSFSVSGEIEKARAKIVKRIPRKRD